MPRCFKTLTCMHACMYICIDVHTYSGPEGKAGIMYLLLPASIHPDTTVQIAATWTAPTRRDSKPRNWGGGGLFRRRPLHRLHRGVVRSRRVTGCASTASKERCLGYRCRLCWPSLCCAGFHWVSMSVHTWIHARRSWATQVRERRTRILLCATHQCKQTWQIDA